MKIRQLRGWIVGMDGGWSAAVRLLVVSLLLAVAASQNAQAQTFTLLYTFTGSPDGEFPSAGLLRTADGSVYGTTQNGGDSSCGDTTGCGTVFKLDTTGSEKVLHAFNNKLDGRYPRGGVVRDAKGNLYGTTPAGGRHGWGTVFKLDKTGKQTVLFAFKNGNDGGDPEAGLILDSAGNLYGTTAYGGKKGGGTVFMLTKSGAETVLHNFEKTDGQRPLAGLVRDSAGNLYGTTVNGGAGYGTVFKVGHGKEAVLYSFTGGTDGAYPNAGLVRDNQGNLYGTTTEGGANGVGVVFKMSKSGQTVLHSFAGGSDGGRPYAGLVRDAKGNLYGTASTGGSYGYGVVFELDTTGTETVLHNFTGASDGAFPAKGLIRDSSGTLYGTAPSGGADDAGTVFKITP